MCYIIISFYSRQPQLKKKVFSDKFFILKEQKIKPCFYTRSLEETFKAREDSTSEEKNICHTFFSVKHCITELSCSSAWRPKSL